MGRSGVCRASSPPARFADGGAAAIAPGSAGLDVAMATLARAALFLGAGLRTARRGCAPLAIEGPYKAKVIGNGLRELDRFLNLLIDEVAALIEPPGIDRASFARQRNTANKLSAIRAAMALPSPDHERLRAVGRSRDCLFHRAGRVHGRHHPCDFGMMIVEGRLTVAPADLERISRFYERVAADLVTACENSSFGSGRIQASHALLRAR